MRSTSRRSVVAAVALALAVCLSVTSCARATNEGASAPETKAPAVELPLGSYPDVPEDHWAHDVIARAAELGIMGGYDNEQHTFGPSDPITRGQAVVALWNMVGHPHPAAGAAEFSDADPEAFYATAVKWASSVNVVHGMGDGRFAPGEGVTREQLASMIAGYARVVGAGKASGDPESFANMADAGDVSEWAANSVAWCFENGILSGDGGQIRPKSVATRAEAAKMLLALFGKVGGAATASETLAAYQAFLRSLAEASSIVIDEDGTRLPEPGRGKKANDVMLYAYAIGDLDANGTPELIVCVRGDAPQHLTTVYVCEYDKREGAVVKRAPSIVRQEPVEVVTCYASGWVQLDGDAYMATKKGMALAIGGCEGRLLQVVPRLNGKYDLVTYGALGSNVEKQLTKEERNAIVSELTAGGILNIELRQATEANIDGIAS